MTQPPAAPPARRPAAGATPPAGALAALAALRERFAASSETTVRAFRTLASELSVDPAAPDVVERLRRALHRLHGTAGTYGFAEASRLAAELEERATLWAADPRLDVDQRAALVEQFVDALGATFTG